MSRPKTRVGVFGFLVFFALGLDARAQTPPPSAGTIQREIESNTRQLPGTVAPISGGQLPQAAPSTGAPPKVIGRLSSYRIEGAGDFEEFVRRRLDALSGKQITDADIEGLKGYISQLFQQQAGRLVLVGIDASGSEAALSLQIQIVSPKVNELRFRNLVDLPPDVVAAVRAGLTPLAPPDQPLDLLALDSRLQVLSGLYQVKMSIEVVAAEQVGAIDLVVDVERRPYERTLGGSLTLNNYGSVAYGQIQGTAYGYTTGFSTGSQAAAQIMGSPGIFYGRLGYTTPLPDTRWTVGAWGSALLTQAVNTNPPPVGTVLSAGATLNTAWTFGRDVSWQFELSPTYTNASDSLQSLQIDHRSLYAVNVANSFNSGLQDNFSFGASMRDDWTVRQTRWNARVTGTAGILDLSANGQNLAVDQAGPAKNGAYGKIQGSGDVAWQVWPKFPVALELSVRGQLAFNNLDALEQFSIGGVNGVKGYAYSDAIGDQGLQASLYLPVAATNDLLFGPGIDYGWIQTNYRPYANPATVPNSYSLASFGFSAQWKITKNIQVTGSVARSFSIQDLPPGITGNMANPPGSSVGWVSLSAAF